MIKNRKLIRRYAAVLYDVSHQNGELDSVVNDFSNIVGIFASNKHYIKLMQSKMSPYKTKKLFINTALSDLKLSNITQNFLEILIRNNKIFMINDVIASLNEIMLAKNGIIKASLTFSHRDVKVEKEMRNQLKKLICSNISVDVEIDKDLLGGFVLKIDNKILDCSLQNQLKKLRKTLELK